MVVYPGSFSYAIWSDLPVPMKMSVYFYNISNSQDIVDRVPGVKPLVNEMGELYEGYV